MPDSHKGAGVVVQGPSYGLVALDEQKSLDEQFKKEDLMFLLEKNLLQQCGSITIDYTEAGNRSGFNISSSKSLPGAGVGSDCNLRF